MQEKTYELLLLIAPDKTEKQHNDLIESVKKHVEELSGKVVNEEIWGLRELAYRVNKHEQGFYVLMDLLMPGEAVKEFENFLRLEQAVLRHMISIPPHEYEPIPYDALKVEEEKLKKGKLTERFDASAKAKQQAVKKAKLEEVTVKEEAKPADEAKAEVKEEDISEALDAKLSKIIDDDMEI